jgi:hypothetical protein
MTRIEADHLALKPTATITHATKPNKERKGATDAPLALKDKAKE